MKAAILATLGKLPHYGDFAAPDVLPGETLVQVRAAAIKPLDRAIAAGTHYSSPKPDALPVICGVDGVGTRSDGTRVYFNAFRRPFGALAELAPAGLVVPVPDGLGDLQAAAVVNPALAAWLPLVWRSRLERGETVLILGATGAAGRMAVHAARLLGAGRIVAAGRNQTVLQALAVDATIDLTLPDDALAAAFAAEAAQGIGVIIDYIWGRPVELLIDSLTKSDPVDHASARPIRLVSVGEMAGRVISLASGALRSSRLEIVGSGTGNFPDRLYMAQIVADILDHAAAGRLSLEVGSWPLADIAAAWAAAATSAARPVITIG